MGSLHIYGVLVSLLLLSCMERSPVALTIQEQESLLDILLVYPQLAQVGVWERYPPLGPEKYLGRPWTTDFSRVCESGMGYDIYGVYCSDTGNVIALFLNDFWGQPNVSVVPDVSGLTFLRNFSATPQLLPCPMFSQILQQTNLEHVIFPSSVVLVPQNLSLQSNLVSLAATINTYDGDWSPLVQLKHLTISDSYPVFSLDKLWTLASELVSLSVSAAQVSSFELQNFTNLATLSLTCADSSFQADLPPALRSLNLGMHNLVDLRLGSFHTLDSVRISSSATIRTLNISSLRVNALNLAVNGVSPPFELPPSLLSLSLLGYGDAHFPTGLNGSNGLQSLSLTGLRNPSFWTNFPIADLADKSSLANLLLYHNNAISNNTLQGILCGLPPNTLRNWEFVEYFSNAPSLPPCLATQHTNTLTSVLIDVTALEGTQIISSLPPLLRSLKVRGRLRFSSGLQFDWNSFSSYFTNLKTLVLTENGIQTDFPQLGSWALSTLVISKNGIFGEFPSNFLTNYPELKTLDMSYNRLSGPLPDFNAGLLTQVILNENRLTGPIASPFSNLQNVEKLVLANNNFTSYSDSALNSMDKLVELDLSSNPRLSGSIPSSWASSPFIKKVLLHNCSFWGGLPSRISSQSLREFTAHNNQLTGPLPDFDESGLVTLQLHRNSLSGSVPPSWKQNLTIHRSLDLSSNQLNGALLSLPKYRSHPYTQSDSQPTDCQYNFSHNSFSQPLDLSSLPAQCLDLSFNPIDPCEYDPQLKTFTLCTLEGLPSFCNCISNWSLCYPDPTCPDAMEPHASPSCPGIGPEGFICVDGVWTSPSSVEQPSLTIPGVPVVVGGNLTITTGITFEGLSGSIDVNGCVYLGDSGVIVQLSEKDMEILRKQGKLEIVAIKKTKGEFCADSTDLRSISATVNSPKGCRKAKVRNTSTSRTSLILLFQVDNSRCNIAIIIPSVIGGLLIIFAIAITVVVVLRKRLLGIA